MKFIHYLERITGVGIYPLISLTVFFLVFILAAVWAWKADKGYINALKALPIAEQNEQ